MELRHLRYFAAVAEAENVSRAALKLHVSQPGVSRQIRDLEEEIGVGLFERGPKSLRLTPAGKVFFAEAKALLERTDQAVKRARAAADPNGGELQVGYAPSLAAELLPPALRRLRAESPGIRVVLHDLSTEEMVTRLTDGRLDVALVVKLGRRLRRGIVFQELGRIPTCIAVAPEHPLAKARTVELARLAQEPLIAFGRRSYPEYLEAVKKFFARAGSRPPAVQEYDDINSVIAAVESGTGFSILPRSLRQTIGRRLRFLEVTPPPPPVTIGVAAPRTPSHPLTGSFAAAMAEMASTLSAARS